MENNYPILLQLVSLPFMTLTAKKRGKKNLVPENWDFRENVRRWRSEFNEHNRLST